MPWSQGLGDVSKWGGGQRICPVSKGEGPRGRGQRMCPGVRVWGVPWLSWKVSHSPVLPTNVNCTWANEVHWNCGERMAAEVDMVRGVGQWGVT